MSVIAGDRAPAFSVDTTEGSRSLDSLLANGSLVLIFYTEDATPTCTAQVRSFSDEYETLQELWRWRARRLGRLTGVASQLRRAAGRRAFPIAADPELELARAYGVVDEEGKRSRRAVFVIGADRVVLEAAPTYHPQAMDQFAAVFRALGLDL